jgi:hypothetical protein
LEGLENTPCLGKRSAQRFATCRFDNSDNKNPFSTVFWAVENCPASVILHLLVKMVRVGGFL